MLIYNLADVIAKWQMEWPLQGWSGGRCYCHVADGIATGSSYFNLSDLFSSVHFSFSALHQLEQLSHLQQSPVPMQFPLPDVVIAIDAMPTHWAFYFQGSGLPLSVSGFWSFSICRAHIALQESQLP